MHFENIGRGLLREGKWGKGEWAVWAKGGGMNRERKKTTCILLIYRRFLRCSPVYGSLVIPNK